MWKLTQLWKQGKPAIGDPVIPGFDELYTLQMPKYIISNFDDGRNNAAQFQPTVEAGSSIWAAHDGIAVSVLHQC